MTKKSNRIIPIAIIISMLALTTFIMVGNYNEKNKPIILGEPNLLLCYQSGLCKIDGQTRPVTSLDIDTGVRVQTSQGVYALVQSRNFNTKDYGQTFPVRIK